MGYNYGTQDVILAGSGDYILCKGDYVYYGYSIEGLLESANSHTRNTDCFGILVGSKKNMFSIQVRDIDGLEWIMEAPAIIFLKENDLDSYEPFSCKEDFLQSYLDHVPNDGLMSELCGEYLLRPSEAGNNLMMVLAIKDSGLSFIDDMDVSWESVKNNYRFLDGSTCGKKVRLEEFSTQRESQEVKSDSTNQNMNIRNPKNLKNGNKVPADVKLVGGKIFYIDNTSDSVYEFFDGYGNLIENVQVGDRPYYYRVLKKGSKDKYYVYHDEIYKYTAWTYCDGGVFMYETLGTRTDIGSGKTNTAMILAKDNGAYIAENSNGHPTIWYRLQQARKDKVGDCDDWFVPSFKEIRELRKAIKSGTVTGGVIAGSTYRESLFSNSNIWSSSEYSSNTAGLWNQYYQNWGNGDKYGTLSAVFIRAF